MSGLTFQDNFHVIAKLGENSINFQAARNDTTTTVGYSAWLSSEGSYIIMEQNRTDTSDITLKYFFAKIETEAFQVAWDDRAGKTFVEYNSLFG